MDFSARNGGDQFTGMRTAATAAVAVNWLEAVKRLRVQSPGVLHILSATLYLLGEGLKSKSCQPGYLFQERSNWNLRSPRLLECLNIGANAG